MVQKCPRCGNLNVDDKKFCTTCGKSLEPVSAQSGSSALLQTSQVMAGEQPDPNRLLKIIAGAVLAVMVIIAILLIMTNPGIRGLLPSSTPPVTAQTMATPVVTSYSMVETPSPEPTLVPAENMLFTTTIPGTSPTPAKAVVCPSDRHICGANCTDIMTDRTNCGACGVSCSSSQICQQGNCMDQCSYGEINCFDGCHNLEYDAQNCGTCGNSCPVGLECNKSICTPPLITVIPTYSG